MPGVASIHQYSLKLAGAVTLVLKLLGLISTVMAWQICSVMTMQEATGFSFQTEMAPSQIWDRSKQAGAAMYIMALPLIGLMSMVMARQTCSAMTLQETIGSSFQMEMAPSQIGVRSKQAGAVTQAPTLSGLMSMVTVWQI